MAGKRAVKDGASPRPGDVVLYHGTSVIGELIRMLDGTDVNHASLCLCDGIVGEVLAAGLVRRRLADSIKDSEWIVIRRIKAIYLDMTPVLDRAEAFLAPPPNRYAYEQIVLLAFLCLTRRPVITPVLNLLIRSVLDAAASAISHLFEGGSEPMICSEFVFRCYEEALPDAEDVYALQIGEGRFAMPEAAAMRGVAFAARPAGKGLGIHPQSLLALMSSEAGRLWMMPPGEKGATEAGAALTMHSLEALMARYLEEVRSGPVERVAPRQALTEEDVAIGDLRDSAHRFALSLYQMDKRHKPVRDPDLHALSMRSPIFENLLRTAADFVTPGDLLKTQSLVSVGRLP